MKIIDVSVHQGKIDWSKVKADKIGGVIIRAGYGKGNIDGRFKENIEGAIKAGFKTIGVYWFSYAYTVEMAKREAQFCNDAVAPYKDHINLGVYFDWEYDSMSYAKKNGVNPNKDLITNMNLYFCNKIKDLGYKAGYYLNLDYQKNFIDVSRLKEFYKWFARYTSEAQKDCYLWQYSSSGKVSGISGNVDMNELVGKSIEHKTSNTKKSNNVIASEVIAGKWGDGSDRKKKLEAAGYDYEAIQNIVNSKLKANEQHRYYIVKTGDTLSKIAQMYSVTVTQLAKWNEIKDVNKIYVGQKLRVK